MLLLHRIILLIYKAPLVGWNF